MADSVEDIKKHVRVYIMVFAALAVLRATSHPDATLHLVGSKTFGTYADALDDYIDELDLADAVVIHEGVSDEELAAHYASADVFVCVSDHEGFCVPLIEAMHHGLPVVAFDSSAVGGTVGSGGIVLRQKSPDLVAAAVRRVLGDQALWSSMSAAGRARAADFDLDRSLGRWSALLDELIGADVAVAT